MNIIIVFKCLVIISISLSYGSIWSFANPLIEFFALENQEVVSMSQNSTFGGDTPSSVDIVSSHHSNSDSRSLTLADGVWNLHQHPNYQSQVN